MNLSEMLKIDLNEINKLFLFLESKNLKEKDIKNFVKGIYSNFEFDGNDSNYFISLITENGYKINISNMHSFRLEIINKNEILLLRKNEMKELFHINLIIYDFITEERYNDRKIIDCEYLNNKINIEIFKNDVSYEVVTINLENEINNIIDMKTILEDKDISSLKVLEKSKLIGIIIDKFKQVKNKTSIGYNL